MFSNPCRSTNSRCILLKTNEPYFRCGYLSLCIEFPCHLTSRYCNIFRVIKLFRSTSAPSIFSHARKRSLRSLQFLSHNRYSAGVRVVLPPRSCLESPPPPARLAARPPPYPRSFLTKMGLPSKETM